MSALAGAVRFLTLVFLPAVAAGFLFWVTEGWGSSPSVIAFAVAGTSLLVTLAYVQALKRIDSLYSRSVANRLSQVFDSLPERPYDPARESVVILSDQHKGTRDGADDFWRAERAYCAALAHYLELDYRLIVLGDAEELWETWFPGKVIAKHQGEGMALALEAEFHAKGRYDRIWGNHDLQWSSPATVDKHLGKGGLFGEGFIVHEGLKLLVPPDQESPGGVLFLVHGHQGTADSEVITRFSRPVVRLFGALQRRFRRGWNTPANDWDLRERHDKAMYDWAQWQSTDGVVLIAGHTHRPVFWNRRRPIPGDAEIARRKADLDAARQARRPPLELAERHAYLALEHAKKNWGAGGAPPPIHMDSPSYFNAGCCSFADGDVTGIEIQGEEIRLVRWLDNDGNPRPHVLDPARARLRDVLAAVHAHRSRP